MTEIDEDETTPEAAAPPTAEEILEAMPDGKLAVTLRNTAGRAIVTNMPILEPKDGGADEFSGLPQVVFHFDDVSDRGGAWPVAEVKALEDGSVQLFGPAGIATVRRRPREQQ
jgi:hypothetical protein